MDVDEFNVWLARYEIEPWGERRADLRSERQRNATINWSMAAGGEDFEPLKDPPWSLVEDEESGSPTGPGQGGEGGGGGRRDWEAEGQASIETFAKIAATIGKHRKRSVAVGHLPDGRTGGASRK